MEINVTKFFNEAAPMDYSASVAEIGNNAGPDTWRAAREDSPEYFMLDTEDKCDAFREHIKAFGAWDPEEIAVFTVVELNALFMQMVAGDMREAGLDAAEPDWAEYEKQAEAGRVQGRLWRADDGDVFYRLDD